jgi:hypothetical protein
MSVAAPMRDVKLELLDPYPPSTPPQRFCFEHRGRLTEVEGSARRSSVRGAEVSDDIPLQALMHAAPNRIRRPLFRFSAEITANSMK